MLKINVKHAKIKLLYYGIWQKSGRHFDIY